MNKGFGPLLPFFNCQRWDIIIGRGIVQQGEIANKFTILFTFRKHAIIITVIKMKKIVWDWNGTLFDDIDLCLECINTLLVHHGLSCLPDKEAYRKVGSLTAIFINELHFSA